MESESTSQQTALLKSTSEALRAVPGATVLCLFGALFNRTADEFSDIDLQLVVSRGLPSKHSLLAALGQVAPVDLLYTPQESEQETLVTVLFRDLNCYHKLDLGMTLASSPEDELAHLPAEKRVLWEQPPRWIPGRQYAGTCCVPEMGTFEHLALGLLLAGIRYAKARKRGQNLTCWRFASAQSEWLWAFLHARLTGKAACAKKLDTLQYVALDSVLDHKEVSSLLRMCDFSSTQKMDTSFVQLLKRSTDEAMPADSRHPCCDRLLRFIISELL